jgi:hypothetical protein
LEEDVTANSGIQSVLAGTKPWVRLVSIIGFISAAFMILGGIAAGVVGARLGGPGTAAIIFMYPVMGLLYLVPSLYLFRYATRIGEYMRGGQEGQLELRPRLSLVLAVRRHPGPRRYPPGGSRTSPPLRFRRCCGSGS